MAPPRVSPEHRKARLAAWNLAYLEKRRKVAREHRATNREAYRQYNNAWQKANPDKTKNAKLKHRLGITLVEYEAMLLGQGGRCAICHDDTPAHPRGWNVDHCHSTGKIRAILCTHCNRLLGGAKDNINTLLAAVEYLREHAT